MELESIKLIIWDLDETFWHGVLSDGNMQIINENVELIKNIVDSGVMCSICSKNDQNRVEEILTQYDLLDLFVFNSINWTPKGNRVKQIVSEMGLREKNVLFIDDNASNRAEVAQACPMINVADEQYVSIMIEYFKKTPHKDIKHERLKQYKVLEKKKSFAAQMGSNEEFLVQSHIVVDIKQDCSNHIERIEELLLRTNQLNFTKVRSSRQEIEDLLQDKDIQAGYISVRDNFGDYGIVGFFAVKNNKCMHFVFSCRVLNMGVEQYVYEQLGKPKIVINGEVSSDLNNPIPYWINNINKNEDIAMSKAHTHQRLLLKGPCDMSQISAYIENNAQIETEFTYVNQNGVSIEGRNHTWHILQSLSLTADEKKKQAELTPFGDAEMYTTAMFDDDIKFVFFSLFTDPHLGLYRDKESGTIVAFGEYTNDLTDENRWNEYINKEVFVANCNFTEESLRFIKNHYVYIGRITPQQILVNLKNILKKMNKNGILILNLGSETPYDHNTQPAYEDRHIYNKTLNGLIRQWAEREKRVKYIDVNDYIHDQESFLDNINHFVRKVYYEESRKMVDIVEFESNIQIKQLSMRQTACKRTINRLKNVPQRIRRMINGN